MSKNSKGLSGIVTTLIIILLTLVAVGVIWGVVSNLLGKSTGTVSTSSKCLDVEVRATKVINSSSDGNYNVTLKRSSTGDEEGVGAKVVFYSDTGNSDPFDFGDTLIPLEVSTKEITGTGVTNADKVEVTVYFIDEESGKETLCSSSTSFEFTI